MLAVVRLRFCCYHCPHRICLDHELCHGVTIVCHDFRAVTGKNTIKRDPFSSRAALAFSLASLTYWSKLWVHYVFGYSTWDGHTVVILAINLQELGFGQINVSTRWDPVRHHHQLVRIIDISDGIARSHLATVKGLNAPEQERERQMISVGPLKRLEGKVPGSHFTNSF